MAQLDQEKLKLQFHEFLGDLKKLLSVSPDPERIYWLTLNLIGIAFALAAIGALLGFVYAYNRVSVPRKYLPTLDHQPKAVYAAMIAGAALSFVVPGLLALFIKAIWGTKLAALLSILTSWLVANFITTTIALFFFRNWRNGVFNYYYETSRYGTARFAEERELYPYQFAESGFFIGENNYYDKAGHLLCTAGTRGGKGVNIILPNLLSPGRFSGSWVVIDPKGENAAISARYQREKGQNVVILNPWELLQDTFNNLSIPTATYNPLDILKTDRLNLSDDVQMIAECIVPTTAAGDTDHFNNRARTVIAGLILHLITSADEEKKHLGTLWEWLRLPDEKWGELLNDMAQNRHPDGGDIVEATAYEILSLKEQGQKEYASVISTAQKWTDFLKSPALRRSLKPDENIFNSGTLADGNTTVYVIIPADRLKTHSQWLRLVSCCLIRAVVRKPNKDVCFLLDEFYALGYLSEIEIGLGAYAGYGIHLFMILQNLVQLASTYGENWENFISSCGVRHFFNVSDVTTANYISAMLGTFSVPVYDNLGKVTGATGRNLVNPDELRQQSGDTMFLILDQLPPAKLKKLPYFNPKPYGMGLLPLEDYDLNPYLKHQSYDNAK